MKILKPKFWEKNNNLISLLLSPISFFLQLLIIIKKKLTFEHSFKIPVICIGNIYLGGTGKTPLTIFIAKELRKHNKKPAIIKPIPRTAIKKEAKAKILFLFNFIFFTNNDFYW